MGKNDYHFDERLDHIAYMFNVRTAGKAYENFIVNAIYTKIGEPELIPVTQQYVYNPRDKRKYYLLDLYFPQLKFGIEVDEKHHLEDAQKIRDIVRAEDTRTAIECEEERISIYSKNGKKRSLEEINEDIEKVVVNIKERISKVAPLKWKTYEDKKEEVIRKGKFVVSDEISYPSVTEIYNICGGRRTGKEKGTPVKALQKCYYRLNDRYKLWVPILAEFNEDKTVRNSKLGYVNTLSDDHTALTEMTEHPVNPSFDKGYKRVVFMRMKDYYGRPCIKFIGVFETGDEKRNNEYIHMFNRISEEVLIEDLKP